MDRPSDEMSQDPSIRPTGDGSQGGRAVRVDWSVSRKDYKPRQSDIERALALLQAAESKPVLSGTFIADDVEVVLADMLEAPNGSRTNRRRVVVLRGGEQVLSFEAAIVWPRERSEPSTAWHVRRLWTPPDPRDQAGVRLADLELPERAIEVLAGKGVTTLGQVIMMRPDWVESIRHVGPGTVLKLQAYLTGEHVAWDRRPNSRTTRTHGTRGPARPGDATQEA